MDDLLRVLSSATADDLAAWRRFVERAGAGAVASWLSPRALVACMLGDTRFAAAALETLRAPESAAAQQVAAAFPEAVALAHPAPPQVEHDSPIVDRKRGETRPLLDHIATRILGTKLAGLEAGELAQFQVAGKNGLSQGAFDELASVARRVLDAGLGPALRAAIIHLDIAKTADGALRTAWAAQGISLEVHNEAAAQILRVTERSRTWGLPPTLQKLAIAWIEAHGLAGQHVRGEGPILMFAPLVSALRELAPALGRIVRIEPHDAIKLALDGLHVLNACDTAAVREGLLDDVLLGKLARVRDQLTIVAAQARWTDPYATLAALAPPLDRARLAERLRSLRAGRQHAGEPAGAVDAAVAALGENELAALGALQTCQLWYCEAATSGLSPSAQLAVLAAAIGAARRIGVDTTRPWHAQLRPLVARLAGDGAGVRYRLRLVEAALAQRPLRQLLTGDANLGPLGTLSARLASATDPDAIVIDYVDTEESAALVTLLGLYETRSQVAFHQVLKSLCDLYGLRKDEFDRVANEASYLASMNAARSDKERMLDFVRPGRIVEIGPGGGIVLDLLEARFPESEIIGVDLSKEVVAALEARARAGNHRWRVALGAAEALPELVSPSSVDTVVFCSILHEVFSYTERGGTRFHLESVRDVVRAAWATLVPGGRIVIRDGVMPPPGTRRIRMLAEDARPVFDLYVSQFEGRKIAYKELAPDWIELSTADAMEFLYTYTWGPASFPYEVRELYGILPYEQYVRTLVDWFGGETVARVVEIAPAMRSYLQPGYHDNLKGKIELTDEQDRPVELPDSNCLIVIERR
ncbi:MAG: methyltransferase [Kofleriaceae bacterium]|nr:methyltransferase [Kofleriaceae bacterium]